MGNEDNRKNRMLTDLGLNIARVHIAESKKLSSNGRQYNHTQHKLLLLQPTNYKSQKRKEIYVPMRDS